MAAWQWLALGSMAYFVAVGLFIWFVWRPLCMVGGVWQPEDEQ